jgi:hypothetical protein
MHKWVTDNKSDMLLVNGEFSWIFCVCFLVFKSIFILRSLCAWPEQVRSWFNIIKIIMPWSKRHFCRHWCGFLFHARTVPRYALKLRYYSQKWKFLFNPLKKMFCTIEHLKGYQKKGGYKYTKNYFKKKIFFLFLYTLFHNVNFCVFFLFKNGQNQH